jgi:hypothetical protein
MVMRPTYTSKDLGTKGGVSSAMKDTTDDLALGFVGEENGEPVGVPVGNCTCREGEENEEWPEGESWKEVEL